MILLGLLQQNRPIVVNVHSTFINYNNMTVVLSQNVLELCSEENCEGIRRYQVSTPHFCAQSLIFAGPISVAQARASASRRDWEVEEGGMRKTPSCVHAEKRQEGRQGKRGRLTVDWPASQRTCTAAHNPQLPPVTATLKLNLLQLEHYAAILHLHKYHLPFLTNIYL